MCGIFASNDPFVDFKHQKKINDFLSFRGPDYQSGLINFGEWKLYHSRLSIIGLKKKFNQPYFCSDGSVLLFNGEIFNFKELSQKYFEDFQTNSDTDLLSRLILKEDFNYNYLDGFYSIVRISKNGKLLNCARDNFGVKPLFYFKRKNYISISSEPSVLKYIFNLKLNNKSLQEYKFFRAPLFSGSYYKKIYPINPGTCLINGKYFNLINYFRAKKKKKKNLEKIIKKNINFRLRSDVKVGLLISSGIDSNLIRKYTKNLKLFSGGTKKDEDYIFLKNQNLKINFTEIKKKNYSQTLKKLIKLRYEPLSVPNEVFLHLIAKSAKKKGFKVLISGEGADEFFGGYDRIYSWAKYNPFNLMKFVELYCYKKIPKNSELLFKLNKLFKSLKKFSSFEKVRFFFIKFHLPILLRRLDFALMSAGVEGREPFLAKEIFFEAIKYNSSELIDDNLGKKPLRLLAKKNYKGDFYMRPKIGFPVNIKKLLATSSKKINNYDIWFKENLKNLKEIQ